MCIFSLCFIGRALGLDDPDLENLEMDYNINGQKEVVYQMLRKWKSKKGRHAKKSVLVEALNSSSVGRGDIVEQISSWNVWRGCFVKDLSVITT